MVAVRRSVSSCTKRSNRSRVSLGPAADSGWNCTEKAGRSSRRRPSTTWSFRDQWETSTRPKRDSGASIGSPRGASTAKPWFWEVMATRPVALSSTGWFGPRWPNFSL
ncbi:hypothetical protein GY12_15560 [Micrococcus luteus]|nr:hypothetical protein GY12_15560 [Micrococcus luteus]